MIVGSLGIIVMIVLLVLGMPIGFGMALVGFVGFGILPQYQQSLISPATVPYDVMANYGFLRPPLFYFWSGLQELRHGERSV